ncbi:helicase-related protein [Klebsiella pneumoniae]|uniref:helicase-related protein n=1 Tax=Klebsiella pneumoniae TaxID=573 RepID=UPI00222871A2|nr:helicase-related protein [Klebsiella pneumoniae]
MLDMGFAQDIETIAGETAGASRLCCSPRRWKAMRSKTLLSVCWRSLEVSANPSTRERKKIHQWYYRADDIEHKTKLLVICCNSRKPPVLSCLCVSVSAHELANWLREAGINTCWLEGEMVQAKRNEAIKRLTDGRVNVLIATDVAARGIDIPDVSHVFNFDMPYRGYLHRIGRTGRAGKKRDRHFSGRGS